MLKRPYGRNQELLSIIGFGGILVMNEDQKIANNRVLEAVDRGINYFDVAPSYGNAEEKLGPALRGKRDKIFLACKTTERTKEKAWNDLQASLKRLETDHFDLYQLHSMTTEEDFEKVIGPNGALEAFLKAKKEGIIRYIGFSAHSVEVAMKLLDVFEFDSVLFPINWVNYFNGNFGPQVVKKAKEKNITILALKAMAKTIIPEGKEKIYEKCWYEPIDDKELAQLALRFTLSQGVTAAIPPGEYKFFPWALEVGDNFKPITEEELNYLRESAKGLQPIFTLSP
ncbi:MAG TPA: aldo/keto reductase [Dictyoglomaceae bacterium]|nr:aldo/keto reductase [Dictyoglomaceae bacterium]HOL38994.1 aldo/keto reductase [Dictyoglomaceae bacterium]HOP94333.1 aldo/keto reductase [Dictyoglomaceae bacterium]HPP15830.1 aldo/keto reductase [Dictyoglomaceae bacterium]HPU42819.1 aldo/keto reductase [Dictyoglomaceae bacterium]